MSETSGLSHSFGLRFLPLVIIAIYVASTIWLFFLGPLPWPVHNPDALILFLACASAGICICYGLGVSVEIQGSPFPYWRGVLILGGLLSCAILFPSAYFFADKMPWEVLDALRDQYAVYEALQRKLAATAGTRTLISIARAITYPLIFAVLPLGILNWRAMTWKLWALLAATVLSSIIFSVLRGTDREVFDIIIVISASLLVLVARACLASGLTFWRLAAHRSIIVGGLIFVIGLGFALNLFADRRMQRTGYTPEAFANGTRDSPNLAAHLARPGGWFDMMCIRMICLDQGHVLIRNVDVPKKYAILSLTGYLTQGYYGLSLALQEDFRSTLGIGHAPVLIRAYERLTHDNSLYADSYTYRLRELNWSDESQWSTIFPWLANDVGFPGAIVVISLLALLWGLSWRDAVYSSDDRAAVVFCLLFQLFVYLPANNQLAQTFDAYLTVVFWTAYWLHCKRRPAGAPTA